MMSVYKRFTLFFFVLCSVSMVFAVNPYEWSSGTINGNAETKVFIDTTGTELCRVGFSTSVPTGYDSAPTSVSADGIKLEWDAINNDGTAKTSSDYYLYYQIKSGADIEIYMYGAGPLTGTEGNTDKVKWYVTVGEGGGVKSLTIDGEEAENDGETEGRKLLIHEHLPRPASTSSTTGDSSNDWKTTTYGAYGEYKISIDTGLDSLWNKKADEYSSTLYVVIVAEEENAPTA